MKRHINVLYGVVVLLLILQIFSFVFISTQVSKVSADADTNKKEIKNSINDIRKENQYNINELIGYVGEQKKDLEVKIDLLKLSPQDFSPVIGEVINGVVSIKTDRSAGSGFIISEDGLVLTNFHVVSESLFVKVQTRDGEIYEARVIGTDELVDLSLLKIEGTFKKLELADSDKLQLGEKVIAIGNPLGLSFTVTEGIVSGTKRKGPNGLESYIQTDVTLNPGNSGGPLISKDGKVVGMNNFKIGNAEGLGFAIESNLIKLKVNEMLSIYKR